MQPALSDNTPLPPEPTDPAGFCERGVLRLDEKRYDEAISNLTEAIRLDPTLAVAHAQRGYGFFCKGEHDAAIADLTEAIRLGPPPWAYRWRGRAFLHQRRFDEALADFDELVRLAPDDARSHDERGAGHHHAGDYESAISDYSRALQLNAQLPWVYRWRGQVYRDLEDWDLALADLNESIRLDPSDAKAHLYRGDVLLALGEPEAACADYSEAIRLDPACAQAYCHRGTLRAEQEDYRAAVDDLTEAIRLSPDDEIAHKQRGLAWDGLGEFEKGDEDFETAHRLRRERTDMAERQTQVFTLLRDHFGAEALDRLVVTERRFPDRVRADLQRGVDELAGSVKVHHFSGIRHRDGCGQGLNLTDLLVRERYHPALAVPPQYEEIDIGEQEPVRCLKGGLWLLEDGAGRFAVLLEPRSRYGGGDLRFQIATRADPQGACTAQKVFKLLEEAVAQARCYRGKILSLEWADSYSGVASGIKVHRLRPVERDQVILPRATLELLERNVIQFVQRRPRLAAWGLSGKKGLLFYGPPGTGKTHTIHYLAGALEGTTTLLISAEQVGLLGEYMTLARLLQPSMVVIEDADLIARQRTQMRGGCEEVLLNKLLNEMDGLKEDAAVLFVLTTNRPRKLEAALTSRPGRIDQAIEFPYPDEEGRAKLVELYARGMRLPAEVVQATVSKTEGVSAAFIKELMRRAAQFRLERDGSGSLALEDVDNALEELLFKGGSLNRKLLGGRRLEEEAVAKTPKPGEPGA
ncbi:MAG: tetratricopeptide repeat protein [Gemmataceae bacterium]|nr:tetratricopeptide repeat protein [Gemmataceae bacterium]